MIGGAAAGSRGCPCCAACSHLDARRPGGPGGQRPGRWPGAAAAGRRVCRGRSVADAATAVRPRRPADTEGCAPAPGHLHIADRAASRPTSTCCAAAAWYSLVQPGAAWCSRRAWALPIQGVALALLANSLAHWLRLRAPLFATYALMLALATPAPWRLARQGDHAALCVLLGWCAGMPNAPSRSVPRWCRWPTPTRRPARPTGAAAGAGRSAERQPCPPSAGGVPAGPGRFLAGERPPGPRCRRRAAAAGGPAHAQPGAPG